MFFLLLTVMACGEKQTPEEKEAAKLEAELRIKEAKQKLRQLDEAEQIESAMKGESNEQSQKRSWINFGKAKEKETVSCRTVGNPALKERCIDKKCSSISNAQKRDECYRLHLVELPSSEISLVRSVAKKMQDTMIQGAAVSAWVKDNSNNITQRQGQELCELLQGRDRVYCMRRLSSPHLKKR